MKQQYINSKWVRPYQSVTSLSSRASMAAMSSSDISKPLMSTFSAMRACFVLLGSGTRPCWRDHLFKDKHSHQSVSFSTASPSGRKNSQSLKRRVIETES